MKISVVSPVYLGEKLIPELVKRLNATLPAISNDYEIILVEDGSPDDSWKVIQTVCDKDRSVKGVKLSKNFGQHYAITCGLELVSGDWIVVMDCDLQDQPEEIPKLFHEAQKGFDIVFAQRMQRQDRFFKRITSTFFYKLFGYLTDTKQDPSIANFGIYHRKAIDAVLEMKDYFRYFPTMVQWVGFNKSKVSVKHSLRNEGKSSYSWGTLIKLAINNIVAFSDKLLRITVVVGVVISAVSFLAGLVYLYQFLNGRIIVLGFTSIIISLFFLSGLIILILGIIGMYIGRAFEQVKRRPTYIIDQKCNF